MEWPVASVLLGTLATLAVGIARLMPRRGEAPGRLFARATDMAEIRARLVNLEAAHHQLRGELRTDIKELQQLVREALAR